VKDFLALGLPNELARALAARGYAEPTPVQAEVIPRILAGENVLFQSETGTGKTLAYLLPAFVRALARPGSGPHVLVVAPTHELASQIKAEADRFAKEAGVAVSAALLVGGAPIKRQTERLKEKPDIALGGPARILELAHLKKLRMQAVDLVVLDEADRMLSPEMRDTLAELLALAPAEAQCVSCSATLSARNRTLIESMLAARRGRPTAPTDANAPVGVSHVTMPPEDVLARRISHWAFYSEQRDKIEDLRRFLVAERPAKTLVFTSVAGQVPHIVERLRFKKVEASGLTARMDKVERKKAIDDFRSGRASILVTSDLAARGLDVPDVTHVVQLDVPSEGDFFVHRAGRTARAGRAGINAVFGDGFELRALARLEKRLGICVYPKELRGGAVVAPEVDPDAVDAGE